MNQILIVNESIGTDHTCRWIAIKLQGIYIYIFPNLTCQSAGYIYSAYEVVRSISFILRIY